MKKTCTSKWMKSGLKNWNNAELRNEPENEPSRHTRLPLRTVEDPPENSKIPLVLPSLRRRLRLKDMDTDISRRARGRASVVAGLFYPDLPETTEGLIRSYGLAPGQGGKAAAIIAPHGAWELSGAVAGAAFSAAAGRGPELSYVVILGITHAVAGAGIFLSDSRYFETPLGKLPVARDLSSALASCSTLIEINDIPHLREHSVEVLLPFVKYCFPRTAIIPILMEGFRPSLISALAKALTIVFSPLAEETLFVVSANLSKHNDEELSFSQARDCLELLREQRSAEFTSALCEGRISPCGGSMAAALLESGLLAGKTAQVVSPTLVRAQGEDDKIVYYGGLAFE
jgi:AmmeMemoRadiSam system protein B